MKYLWETYYDGKWTSHKNLLTEDEAHEWWGTSILGAGPIPYRKLSTAFKIGDTVKLNTPGLSCHGMIGKIKTLNEKWSTAWIYLDGNTSGNVSFQHLLAVSDPPAAAAQPSVAAIGW